MGKSMSGPDETDVLGMMTALSSLHSGHVEVSVQVGGLGFGLLATVFCRMHFTVLPGSSLPSTVEIQGTWPCADHQTLWGHIYAGLYRLDYAISKEYKNEALWAE